MDYSKLKAEIKAIAEIAESVPEAFREKCFELLLNHLLVPAEQPDKPAADPDADTPKKPDSGEDHQPLPKPAAVKAFMKKTGVTDEQLAALVYYEDEELHFLAEPSTGTISRGQIEWALLMGLRNAITEKSFEVDPEGLRSMCQEKGYYDATNFWKTFKSAKNAAYFNGDMEAQGDARKLTAAGQEELAKVIKELAS